MGGCKGPRPPAKKFFFCRDPRRPKTGRVRDWDTGRKRYDSAMERKGAAFAGAFAVVLAALLAVAYANSFSVGFLFDDGYGIAQNPALHSLKNVPRFFADPFLLTPVRENVDLRPLLLVTYALNYAISGLAPWSWHSLNLLLHFGAALMVFFIVRDHVWWPREERGPSGMARWPAAAAALLFALAPINHQPVVYLWARSALLCGALMLASFLAFFRERRALSAALFALPLLSLTGCLAWIGVAAASARKHPLPAFATAFYFLALAPESTLSPISETINDHRPYLATSLGLALLTAWAVWEGARRLAWRPEPAIASVTLLACAAAIPVVWQRNRVWRDGLSLWQDAVAKGPGNGRAALNLGRELMARGKLAEARTWFDRARAFMPQSPYVYMNLSVLEDAEG